ncbi:hypothetical protein K461DRAFT_276911 [Myriangium duriaei CBS 260.36]|uniref:Uncharacterized protein n=1 Tax=Myriangium duriaei CBS 260.36 TaxID=1168546 RepID=A0A9P4MGP5_9PEZI|nr:hypothetical protein K461DRAFT_276911 [Myriangium duriaei CBS 260.36]
MASATPWPVMRTVSTEHLDIRSPVPDSTSTPDGSICRNVERLEQSAEELSQGGSDIGEEIRKLQEEQRRTDSRRSSTASRTSPTRYNLHSQPLHPVTSNTRSRGASASSYSNSIVDLNREARWGGYSPAGFIGSPAASIHSGSWAQPAVLHRSASNAMSISTRPEPVQEGRPLDSPLTSPVTFTRQASNASFNGNTSIQNSSSSRSRRNSRASGRLSIRSAASGYQPETLQESQIHNSLDNMQESEHSPEHLPNEPLEHFTTDLIDQSTGEPALDHHDDETPPGAEIERPGSTDTFRQANLLFEDFDGVHFSPANEEFIATDEQGNVIGRIPLEEANEALIQQELLSQPDHNRVSFAQPPLPDNMVYYPAPVPRILNLPKRLSTRPPSTMYAQQRASQMMLYPPRSGTRNTLRLSAMDFEDQPDEYDQENFHEEDEYADEPAPLSAGSPSKRPDIQQRSSMASLNRMSNMPSHTRQKSSMASLNRMSTMPHLQQRSSMASLNRISNIPPQLRASLFFDQPGERQSVNIQSDSAVATLDSILQASATAPVSVFTDHPFAGRAGADVYAKEARPKRNTMSKPLVDDAKNSDRPRHSRSVSNVLDGQTSGGAESRMPRRNSVMSLLTDLGNPEGKKLQKRNSRLSLGSQDLLNHETGARAESPAPSALLNGEAEHEDYEEEHANEDENEDDDELQDPDMGPVYAQPTTLLAELQLRKAQQKSRNRTAANAFPNGMHATLLELDAVAQIESRKRKNHKVALAWEDPAAQTAQEDEPDEDVPLAVLYPTKNGLGRRKPGESDWDRPIGLIERRQLEDNEPLSRRRNRLLGINPRAASRLNLSAEPSPTGSLSPRPSGQSSHAGEQPEDPDEDIPLAERKRRMQQKAALDSALAEVSRDSKSTFEAEVLSVLGVPAAEKAVNEAEKENVEETLGQRRARLQREKSGLTQTAAVNNVEGGAVGGDRPALRSSMSLANLLASVPMDPNTERINRRNMTSPAPTSLLGQHESQAAQQKAQLREHNARKTSYQHPGPQGGLQRTESQAFEYQQPGQINNQGQVNGLISSAGGGVTNSNRRASTTFSNLQSSASVPGVHAAQLQSKIQAGLAQQGQMMNPLAFSNFVPPAPTTGLGFNGGMAAAPGYGGMMGGMQQAASMPFGFMNGAAQHPLMGYGNGMAGMNGNMNMNMAYGMGMGMGMGTGMPYGYNGMGMNPAMAGGYGMLSNDGLNPAKRDTIDRWRSGVGP